MLTMKKNLYLILLLSLPSVSLYAGCALSCLFPVPIGSGKIGEPFDFGQGIEYFDESPIKGAKSGYYITNIYRVVDHCGSVDSELMRVFVKIAAQRNENGSALILKYKQGLPHNVEAIDEDSVDYALLRLAGVSEKTESHKIIETFLRQQQKIIKGS
jgi:hypothetical protein